MKRIILILMSLFIIIMFSSTAMAAENNTIIVDDSSTNQMNNPTIQTAIDSANAGDTIEITGKEYYHCHFVVDKRLTIISNVETTLNTCPSNTAMSNGTGIFYFTQNASGSVLSGFTLKNDAGKKGQQDPYAVHINGADNVKITGITVKDVDEGNGIYVINSNGTTLTNNNIMKTNNGIKVENSQNTLISDCEIRNNENSGIYIGKNVNATLIKNNSIHNNNWKGIYIASAFYTNITSNEIYENKNKIATKTDFLGTGIYINSSIIKLRITGNHIHDNGDYGIFTSPEAMDSLVDENVEIIDGNIFYGHQTRAVYAEDNYGCTGTIYVWSNFYSGDLMCPSTSYAQGVLVRISNYRDMTIGNITEVSPKVYSVSFIRKNTSEILTDINSFDVTFFLNKNSTKASVQQGDIAKTVRVINGTATADFSDIPFKQGENTIIAVSPGKGAIDFTKDSGRLCSILYVNNGTTETILSKLTSENITFIYGQNQKYNVKLNELNGKAISDMNVNVIIDGKIYSRITDENGSASIDLNLTPGKYSAVAMFCGNQNYECNNLITSITILETVSANDTVKLYKNGTQFKAVFSDENGNPLNKQKIQFTINGINYTRTTNDKGLAKININLEQGNYTVISTNPITKERAINTVTVLPLICENNDLTKYYRNSSQYSVKVLDSTGKTAEGEVRFNINGVFYNRQIHSNGIAKLNINLNPGQYIITGEYNGCKVSNIITVLPVLYADDLTKEYNTKDQFKIKVVDGQGNPIARTNVTFNINGVFYTRTSNQEGIASLNIKLLPNTYIITSTYNGLNMANNIKVLESVKIAPNLTNTEIQKIIDAQTDNVALRFEGSRYDDISLKLNKAVLLTGDNTKLNGKANSDVITVKSSGTIIKNLNINSNNASGIKIEKTKTTVINNNITEINNKNQGTGIYISSSQNKISNNNISNFENGIYLNSLNNSLSNNEMAKNTNGIEISRNLISSNVTLQIDEKTNTTSICGEDNICQIIGNCNATVCIPCDGNSTCNTTLCIPCLENITSQNCNLTICIPCDGNSTCKISICDYLKACVKDSN